MPVARSDPRKTTLIGIAGILFGVVMIVVVLALNSSGGSKKTVSASATEVDVGRTSDLASAIARDRTPVLLPDLAEQGRPLVVQHQGDDDATGWLVFDANVDGCTLQWHVDTQDFTGCDGKRYPADGAGIAPYPSTVKDGHLIVNLDRASASTTTPAEPTTTILVTN